MTGQNDSYRGKRGAALVTVMAVIGTVSMLLTGVLSMAVHSGFMARKLGDRIRATAIAEAGAVRAYTMLVTNFAQRTDANAFPITAYGGGTYDADVVPVSNDMAVVVSEGVYRGTAVTVILDVRDCGGSGDPGTSGGAPFVCDYAMLCGTLDFLGCGSISSTSGAARVHSNGDMLISGNAQANVDMESSTYVNVQKVTVDGDVTGTSLDVHGQAVITGTASEEPVPLIEIPDINLTPYYLWALAHGEVCDGDFSMSGGTYTPNGGILWVEGDVSLASDYVFYGSIIATGEIHVSGSGDVIATTCAFSLVTRDGPRIFNQSTGTIRGVVYVKNGDYRHTANGRVEGSIIVAGNIHKGGNSDVLLYLRHIIQPPDTGAAPTPDDSRVCIVAWQK